TAPARGGPRAPPRPSAAPTSCAGGATKGGKRDKEPVVQRPAPSRVASVALAVVCLAAAGGRAAERSGPPAIRLTSPKGGESWSAGSKHYVTWQGDRLAPNETVKIDYSVDGGKTWREAAAAPNSGRFLWKVPDRVSAECRVRVSARRTGTSAESPSAFSIIPSQEVRDYEWVSVTT